MMLATSEPAFGSEIVKQMIFSPDKTSGADLGPHLFGAVSNNRRQTDAMGHMADPNASEPGSADLLTHHTVVKDISAAAAVFLGKPKTQQPGISRFAIKFAGKLASFFPSLAKRLYLLGTEPDDLLAKSFILGRINWASKGHGWSLWRWRNIRARYPRSITDGQIYKFLDTANSTTLV
jgi:hypothetical protein